MVGIHESSNHERIDGKDIQCICFQSRVKFDFYF